MKENQKLQGKFALAFGVLLVLVTLGLMFLPTLTLKLYAWYYLDATQEHYAELAQPLKPQLEETNEPTVHFAFQEALRLAGRHDELFRVYKNLQQHYPNKPSLHFYLARITGDNSWITSLPGDHHSIEAAIAYRADEQFEKGRYTLALKHANRLPGSWLKSFLTAEAQSRMGQLETAQQSFETALEQAGSPLWVRIRYAELLYCHQVTSEKELFDGWTHEQLLQFPKAYAYRAVMSGKEILDVFNQAPEAIICQPEPLNILAWEALRQADLVAARILLNRSDQIQRSQPEVTALFGILAQKEERTQYAQRLMKTGLDSDAYSNEFHRQMGDVLSSWSEFEAAIPHYQKVWNRLPDNPNLLHEQGRLLFVDGQPCEALKALKRALDLQPDDPDLQTWLEKAQQSCKPAS